MPQGPISAIVACRAQELIGGNVGNVEMTHDIIHLPAFRAGDRVLVTDEGHTFAGRPGRVERVTVHGRVIVKFTNAVLQMDQDQLEVVPV